MAGLAHYPPSPLASDEVLAMRSVLAQPYATGDIYDPLARGLMTRLLCVVDAACAYFAAMAESDGDYDTRPDALQRYQRWMDAERELRALLPEPAK